MAKKPQKNNKNKVKPTLPRPLWYAILVGGIVALFCALFLIIRWSVNAYYVAEAKKGRYHYELEKMITTMNFPDGYVVWYNIGNYHFQQGDFEEAESDYYRAIEKGIPYEKECPVKVNLALSMIEQLSDDEWDAFFDSDGSDDMNAQARKVEKTLVTARTILIEDGCAHEDDEDGHNEQAQILKDEIDELLQNNSDNNDDEEDENEDNSGGDEGNDDESGESGQDQSSSREDQVMEHIQDQKEEAQAERADDQQFYENYYGFGDDNEGGSGDEGGGGSAEDNGEIW